MDRNWEKKNTTVKIYYFKHDFDANVAEMNFQLYSNSCLKLLFLKWQKCPHLFFMGRMDGRWASLGTGNPGGPESIGNNLGLGSDGPRIQLCTNVKTFAHT